MEHSGGPLHIKMVKEAVKIIADRFSTMNKIMIQFEPWHKVNMRFQEDRYEKFMHTPQLDFRPDIMLSHMPPDKRKAQKKGLHASFNYMDEKVWETIEDSTHVIFEVETDPRNIFRSILKIEYYKRMKDERQRRNARLQYSFVLVAPEGAKLPADTEPFDEVWTIPKSKLKEVSVR